MTELILYIVAAGVAAGAILLLLRRSRPAAAGEAGRRVSPAEFFPLHSRYFPQVRHAISGDDATYLAGRASPAVYRRWKKALRHAGRLYLAALREDFSRLNRLARAISLYSPEVKAQREAELFRLNLRFQLLYGVALWRFVMGRPAEDRLEQMAKLIGSLESRLEQAALAPPMTSGAVTP